MPDSLNWDPVDSLAAGAVGAPGQRSFYIQATKDGVILSVLVEKQQVAALAERIHDILGAASTDYPEDPIDIEASLSFPATLDGSAEPLFRATVMGIGFDPERRLVVLELYERAPGDDGGPLEGSGGDAGAAGPGRGPADAGAPEPHSARLFATRGQARAMAIAGAASVESGRPPCQFCGRPQGDDHVCPATNGHGHS